jgi:hypothetical protein
MVSAVRWSGSWRLGAAGFAAVYAIAEVYAFLAARLYGGSSAPAALYLFGAGGIACWVVVWVVHRLVRR